MTLKMISQIEESKKQVYVLCQSMHAFSEGGGGWMAYVNYNA